MVVCLCEFGFVVWVVWSLDMEIDCDVCGLDGCWGVVWVWFWNLLLFYYVLIGVVFLIS